MQAHQDIFSNQDLHVSCYFCETDKIEIINLVSKSSINGEVYEKIKQVENTNGVFQ